MILFFLYAYLLLSVFTYLISTYKKVLIVYVILWQMVNLQEYGHILF
jgi:hypothetical protein